MWEAVGNIESPTSFKEGVDKVSTYFADMAKKLGFDIEYSRQDNAGDVLCITMNPDSKEKPVVLSGHIDTVHPLGMFGTPPVHLDDENLFDNYIISFLPQLDYTIPLSRRYNYPCRVKDRGKITMTNEFDQVSVVLSVKLSNSMQF